MLEKLTSEDFLPHVGTAFVASGLAAGDIPLSLVEVKDLGPRPASLVQQGTRANGFSLRFAGPAEPFLPQKTWSLSHEVLGTLSIFLVPIGRDGGRLMYEAIFN